MRVNPKLYPVADEVTPFETQNCGDKKIELYLMDSFEGIKEEFVMKKGQFAVWSSADGINYRLFLENGYYDRIKELYSEPVNKIWLDFYDTTDKISKKFSNYFIYPLMAFAVIACIASIFLSNYMPPFVSWIIIGVLAAMFVAMIFVNMKMKKAILAENTKSRQQIIDHFGGNRFDELIEMQKTYMDEYFENLYPEDKSEENTEENVEENNNVLVEDTDAEAVDAEASNTLENVQETKDEVEVVEETETENPEEEKTVNENTDAE